MKNWYLFNNFFSITNIDWRGCVYIHVSLSEFFKTSFVSCNVIKIFKIGTKLVHMWTMILLSLTLMIWFEDCTWAMSHWQAVNVGSLGRLSLFVIWSDDIHLSIRQYVLTHLFKHQWHSINHDFFYKCVVLVSKILIHTLWCGCQLLQTFFMSWHSSFSLF